MAKYVFDSNIFINLQRRQPIDVFPSLWEKIGELMDNGTIISSREVYDEIMIGGYALHTSGILGEDMLWVGTSSVTTLQRCCLASAITKGSAEFFFFPPSTNPRCAKRIVRTSC